MEQLEWIKVENISKSFQEGFWMKKREVLHQINFSLIKGRSVGFVGPNGSGKTTLMKIMLGFIFPDQGCVRFPALNHDFDLFKSQLGFLPERPYFYDFLTAKEFLLFHWYLGKSENQSLREERINLVLKKVKLFEEKHRKIRTFSKGMLQRIGLAQALLHQPQYLILDEPMSGLDPDGRYEMRVILKEEKERGVTILFSSHLIEDVELICDDILIIQNGKLIYFGSILELKEKMQDPDLYSIINRLKVGGRS